MSVSILKHSPNYDKIVDFLYKENDNISKQLIECYQEYLFTIKSVKSKENIDNIMNLYTEKEDFYKYVQNYFSENDCLELYDSYDKVIKKLIKVYKEYEEERFKKIKNTRWV